MTVYHPSTGFAIGDPDVSPLIKKPSQHDARAFFSSLILSASGWRGVFGAFDDDLGESISPSGAYAAARMALTFADYLLTQGNDASAKPVVALGIDTRPTGPAIADVMARVFLARGLAVRYAFICSAPEIMAWARRSGATPPGSPERLDAFCYVSASHNPPGHNGVKFGLVDGGVLPATITKQLIATLVDGAGSAADIDAMAELVASVDARTVSSLYSSCQREKRAVTSAYTLFTREVAGASDILREQERELDTLSEAVTTRGVSILADMNGSARSLSIDSDFLSSLGVSFTAINNTPRRFAHRIVPEGESLEPCRLALKKAREHDPSYEFGYVPDCDGDRGNFVYWNDDDGEAYSLEAQDSFALAVLAELATTVANASRDGKAAPRMAVACNDATSLRVEAIAGAFGARVFRAETGEANVVGLARSLREQGYEVRVLGEGSNGGVITHPASVRDPLNTTTAILKLLYLRDLENDAKRAPGPFRLWLERTGRADDYHEQFAMCDVLASLPRFATTSVFEPRAALTVRTRNHAALKGAYEPLFRAAWPVIAAELEPVYGPLTWQAYASAGSGEHELTGGFAESGSGGLRIVFYDGQGVPAGFLWMRGSGTEPVFRIMADLRGDDGTLESLVLERHTALVREADSLVI